MRCRTFEGEVDGRWGVDAMKGDSLVIRLEQSNAVLSMLRAIVLVVASWTTAFAWGETPALQGRVTDPAGILSRDDNRRIASSLAAYERETTHQIAVLIVNSLGGESIEDYARRVANEWGLGRKGINNGMLIVLVPAEKKARIELGRGFERYISNEVAGDILRTRMLPEFAKPDFPRGLERGLEELMRLGRAFVHAGTRKGYARLLPRGRGQQEPGVDQFILTDLRNVEMRLHMLAVTRAVVRYHGNLLGTLTTAYESALSESAASASAASI